jgi:hypothetical protein
MSTRASNVLLTINVTPALEDPVVDWLLGRGLDQGFTCARVDGHGSDHERFSIAEQVRGRQHRVEFRVLLDEAERDDLLESLAAEFFGADLFYFMTPVLQMGHLGRSHALATQSAPSAISAARSRR